MADQSLAQAAGAAPAREQWLPIEYVAHRLALTTRTLRRWREEGTLRTREEGRCRNGRPATLIAVGSLPPAEQRRLATALPAPLAYQPELPLEGPPTVEVLLGRHPPELREMLIAECDRRARLLERFERCSPKEIGGRKGVLGPSAEVALIQHEWAAGLPPQLAARYPSWRRQPTVRNLRRLAARAMHGGAFALLRQAGTAKADDPRRLDVDPRVVATLRQLYLEKHIRTKARLYRMLVAACKTENLTPPSESWVRRYVAREITHDERIMRRVGPKKWEAVGGPFITRDYSGLCPGEIWCGDHHQFDVVTYGKDGRPRYRWLTAWLDLGSRALIGYCVCEQPNSRTILRAFVHGVRPNGEHRYERLCGLPAGVYVDNGKDYRSRTIEGQQISIGRLGLDGTAQAALRGLFPELRIAVQHATPYNAKAKAVESFFRTLELDFGANLPGYRGASTEERPERLDAEMRLHAEWMAGQRRDTPLLHDDQFDALLREWLLHYHTRQHTQVEDRGRHLSPLAVYELYGSSPVLPAGRTLEFLCMEVETRKVRRNGIKMGGFYYWSDDLIGIVDHDVEVRRDPDDVSRIYVFPAGNEGRCIEAVSLPIAQQERPGERISTAAFEAIARIKRARKRAVAARAAIDAQLALPADPLSLLERVVASPPPDAPPVSAPPPPAAAAPPPADTVDLLVPRYARAELRTVETPPSPPARAALLPPEPESPDRPIFTTRAQREEWERRHPRAGEE